MPRQKAWLRPENKISTSNATTLTSQEHWLAKCTCYYGWHFPVPIDRSLLVESLQSALTAYPLLTARLSRVGKHTQLTTAGSPGALFVQETTNRHTTATWQHKMKQFDAKHFAFSTPPLFEPIHTRKVMHGKAPLFIAKLVYLADGTCLLLLSFSHAVRGTWLVICLGPW